MTQPKRQLTLLDSTSLIVGIIIGAGIYQMAPDIARGAGGPWGVAALWLIGGGLSLCGALSYAELATAYPEEGGDYVFLGRAYGSWAGFLFAWAQMAVVRPGDIAVMAFAFATYARALYDPLAGTGFAYGQQVYAVVAVLALTGINILGVRLGAWAQNLLTLAKVGGLLLVIGTAFVSPQAATPAAGAVEALPWSLALIFVLFAYGGWNEMAYVAAEVRDPERNIGRALVTGTLAVILLYLLVNAAFLHALGYQGVTASRAVATDTVARLLPGVGAALVSGLICVSALGAVNGLTFTGARISYALGRDYPLFRWLGHWHPRWGTPAGALALQGMIAVLLILALGSFLNAILYTAAVVYLFYGASALAVLRLRHLEPGRNRPFRVPGYPWTPLIFAGTCLLLIRSAVHYKPRVAAAALALLALGWCLWRFVCRTRSDPANPA